MLPIESKINNIDAHNGYIYAEELNAIVDNLNSVIINTGDKYNGSEPKHILKAIDEVIKHNSYTDTGGVNDIVLERTGLSTLGFDDYDNNISVFFKASSTNTGPSTITLGTGAPKNLIIDGQQLVGGELESGKTYIAKYTVTNDVFDLVIISSDVNNDEVANETGDNTKIFNVAPAVDDKNAINVNQLRDIITAKYNDVNNIIVEDELSKTRITLNGDGLILSNLDNVGNIINSVIISLIDDGNVWTTELVIGNGTLTINNEETVKSGSLFFRDVISDPTTIFTLGDLYITSYGNIYKKVDVLGNVEWEGKGSEFFTEHTDDVKIVSLGNERGVFIRKADGTLWTRSSDTTHGYTGTGGVDPNGKYIQVPNIFDVKDVSYVALNSFAIKNDGSLWACGRNTSGQLGVGDDVNKLYFTYINITNVKVVVGTSSSTLILKNDGTVWAAGHDGYGLFTINDDTNHLTWFQLPFTDIVDIQSMNYSYILKKSDGSYWGFGLNSKKCLGLSTSGFIDVLTDLDLTDTKLVKLGPANLCVIKNDGTLWVAGGNVHGELGIGQTASSTVTNSLTNGNLTNVKDVWVNQMNVFILLNDGSLYFSGYNDNYNGGTGDQVEVTSWVQVASNVDKFFKSPTIIGSIFENNTNPYSQTCIYVGTDGYLYGTGGNEYDFGLDGYLNVKVFTKFYKYDDIASMGLFSGLILNKNERLYFTHTNYFEDTLGYADSVSVYTDTKMVDFVFSSDLDASELP